MLAARPDRLFEVRPQERVLRRTAKQNVDVFAYPLLDVLVPQMGDQLVEVLRKIDTRSSHQAIQVPKVFPDSAPLRRVESRPPQLAEQLGTWLLFSPRRSVRGENFVRSLQGYRKEGDVHVEVFKVLVLDRIQQRLVPGSSTVQFPRFVGKVVVVSKVLSQY